MTSKEIAELTGKLHTNVLRDIRAMLQALGQAELSFESSYTDSTGRALPMFALPKDLTLTLVTGYNVVLRNRIVNRWIELESAPAFALPNFANPAEAARAWAVPGEAAAVTVGPIQHWKGLHPNRWRCASFVSPSPTQGPDRPEGLVLPPLVTHFDEEMPLV